MANIDWTGDTTDTPDTPPPVTPISTQPLPRTTAPMADPLGAPASNGFGNPAYDRVADVYRRQTTGRYNPTMSDVSQWGTNINDNYLANIQSAISTWWQQYQKDNPTGAPAGDTSGSPDTTSTPGAPGSKTPGDRPPQVQNLEQMLQRGGNPNDIARDINRLYGLTTGNEVYYDPQRNIMVTPWSGYFANGPTGWQWAGTHPEGQGGPTTGAPLNYQQQLAYIKSKLGRDLTPAEMTSVRAKFGGTEHDTTSPAILDQVITYLKGAGGTGTGTGARSPFQPLDNSLSGTYTDAINVIRDRYKQYYGRDITDAQLSALTQKYGLTPDVTGTQGTPGTRQTTTKIDANLTGSADQALAYINGEAQRVLGRQLTSAEVQQAASMIGYSGGQVTGAQVNQILGALDGMVPMSGGTQGTPGSTHTYTGSDLNRILQELYNGVGASGTGGPGVNGPGTNGAGGGGNPGGYTDPSSQIYLNQVMQRLLELRTPTTDPWQNILQLFGLNRVNNLQGDPYTAGNDAALIAKYRDPLTQARDTAKQQALEEISRRGMGASSGLLSHRMGQIDQGYEQGLAKGANDLGVRAVDESQRRQDESLQILSNLLNVNRSGVDRQNANYDQALSVAKLFPDFDEKRLQDLLAASGEGPNSSGLLANINELAKLGNNINNTNNANSQNNSALWGQIIGALLGQLTH